MHAHRGSKLLLRWNLAVLGQQIEGRRQAAQGNGTHCILFMEEPTARLAGVMYKHTTEHSPNLQEPQPIFQYDNPL